MSRLEDGLGCVLDEAEARVEQDRRRPSWDLRVLSRLLTSIGQPRIEAVLWTGESIRPQDAPPLATVRFKSRRALLKSFWASDVGFGAGYASGEIEVDGDLVRLVEETFSRMSRRRLPWWQVFRRSPNTLSGSRDNIHRHYDIGNDFYRLWLDDRMVYTCAYFPEASASLEAAQLAKMDLVCRKLRLRPGEHVIEAGCGWGSMAMHMAAHYGVRVRAFNISHEQIVWARERARREGLEGRVEFIEDDYRNIAGSCDAFVSIGMLEHVGVQNFSTLGAVIDRCLTREGRGLIHTIGRHRPMIFGRWITSRIFPGAEPPALSQMMEIFEPFDFAVLDVENLRLHYAWTLRHWLERFERAVPEVARTFDEPFIRTWRLYLASSIASFTTGWTQLYQVVFNRFTNNDVAATRAHLYVSSEGR
jgi:cyclopropane-fatty-acyl-phospholipid synthase